MAYEVLARKWRPKTFDDVVGQDHVVQTLKHAIEIKRLAHAYLFVGPRGIGKTSIARIFAKALNCKEGPTTTPCGVCDACREIAAGTNLDVMEIDGASNNSVDQVRDLRDTVRYAPTHGAYKIYIIDEVHMLSNAAFNALLKTLEEPPAHVKFIFATTDPHKILPTVISRCQRFDLRRITMRLLVEKLRAVADAEGAQVADDALLAIARAAEGSLRDAESALDQLIAFRGNQLLEEDVLSVFGLVGRAHLEALARGVLGGDLPGLLRVLASLDDAGKDLQRLVFELIEYFRHLLVCLSVDDFTQLSDVTDDQLEALKALSVSTNVARVLRVVEILSEAEDRMRGALSRRSVLETALIRCARAANTVSLEEILAKIIAWRAEGGAGAVPAAGSGAASPAAAASGAVVVPSVATPPVGAPVAVQAAPAFSAEADLAKLRKAWAEICAQVGKFDLRSKGVLAGARPLAVEVAKVVVGFDAEFADELEMFRSGRGCKGLENALATCLGRRVAVAVTLAEMESQEKVAAESVPVAVPDEVPAPRGEGRGRKDWTREPVVQKTLEAFGGRIVDVRE